VGTAHHLTFRELVLSSAESLSRWSRDLSPSSI
jgi:hypothetical protein